MLLYNNKQEFIGIDDGGLHLLNYASLEELLNVCSDVADLFANEPGYIHNFKNFGWIDFLLHADSDASSAIVHGNGRTFSCRLSVSAFHLCSEPSASGYSIEMSQIKSISGKEIKPHLTAQKAPTQEFVPPSEPILKSAQPAPLPDHTHLTATQLSEPTIFDIPKTQPTSLDETEDLYTSLMAPLSVEELDSSLEKKDQKVVNPISESAAIPASQPSVKETTQYSSNENEYLSHHKVDSSYTYDPNIAANELGLPVDLIEEFIGDFIQQSHEFRDELYDATEKNDINKLHILSHKLKGVAANLRIENALEALTIINSSADPIEIQSNLKYYYSIIAKLEGKEVLEIQNSASQNEVASEPDTQTLPEPEEDIYAFSLKQNDNETLLVHLDEIDLEDEPSTDVKEEKLPFKKELLELEEELLEESADKENIPLPLHYDLNAVSGALGMEPAFMEELLKDYRADALAMSTTIRQAIKAFDTHTWKSSAAKLKGISDNLRLSEISDELAILSITNDAQEAKKASGRLINYLDQL
ncbi:MAG: hypothetical protein M1300_11040 [Epsilonproteobacteria bacterium]|nr:hypothetical protein [Campylobacterota bacterium]